MAIKTFYVTKDARVARRESDNWDSGSGTSDGLPFGLYGGYRYRVLLGFSVNMAGWTAINSATLHYRTSNQIHVAFGSDPTIKWQRLTASWSEGGNSGLSASNAVIYPGPAATAANEVIDDAPTTESTWGTASITAMMRDVLAGGAFYGVRGIGVNNDGTESDAASQVGEIYSREQGSDAYITIDYETNTAPTVGVPAIVGASGGIVNDTTPDVSLLITDNDGDNIASYRIQVSTINTFASTVVDQTVAGPWATPATRVFTCPVTLTRGATYYVRALATDSNGAASAWSSTTTIKIASLPVVALTEPSGAGRLGKMVYTAGSLWTSPRLEVDWTFSCPDGGTQTSWRVEVNSDAAGAPGASFNDSGVTADSAARQRIVPATFVEGSYYHVRVTCVCSHGASTVVGYYRIRVRWGVVTHVWDMGSTITNLALTALEVVDSVSGGGAGRVVVEYATLAAAPPTAPTVWFGSLASAGLQRYFWYRVFLLAWGASPAVSPQLNRLTINYSTLVIVPDDWTRQDPVSAADDVAAYVYGVKSLKLVGKGATHAVYQQVAVVQDTDYILSGRIQSQGNSGAYISLATLGTSGDLAASTPIVTSIEFEDAQKRSRVKTPVWNSGEATSVWVRCVISGAAGTYAWFDALKLEASVVVTPWSPSMLGNAVVIDSGGVSIDASAAAAGIFRLRASTGGLRDEVDLGSRGLTFGPPGDAMEVYSGASGQLNLGAGAAVLSTGAFVGKAPIVRVLTAGGTWTKPVDLAFAMVEVMGGGGAGGGAVATAAGQMSSGAGAGAGGYVRKLYSAAALPAASYVYTVGAAGVGNATGTGGAGGASTFVGPTGTLTAGGGGGGTASGATSASVLAGGGNGGAASGPGDLVMVGAGGTGAGVITAVRMLSGTGGSSPLGGAGRASNIGAGQAASGYGAGGGGGTTNVSTGPFAGGDGSPGVVIITEFYGP